MIGPGGLIWSLPPVCFAVPVSVLWVVGLEKSKQLNLAVIIFSEGHILSTAGDTLRVVYMDP